MKIKNVMFSGVMAAILMSVAGAANAADPISVASTGYVDTKVGVVSDAVEKTSFNGTNYLNDTVGLKDAAVKLDTQVKTNADKISALDSAGGEEGITGFIDRLSTAEGQITLLNEDNAEKAGTIANKIAQAVSGLDTVDEAVEKQFVTAVSETDGKLTVSRAALEASDIPDIAQSQVQGLEAALGNKADKSIIGEVEAGKTVVQMIADVEYDDTKVTEDIAANTTAITDLETGKQAKLTADNLKSGGAANVSIAEDGVITISATDYTAGTNVTLGENNSINVTMAESVATGGDAAVSATQVQGYAIPKPSTNCEHTKCVLSVDQNGAPYWMELALSVSDAE